MVKFKNILVTGEQDMIQRHQPLFEAIKRNHEEINIRYLSGQGIHFSRKIKKDIKETIKNIPFLSIQKLYDNQKNPDIFAYRSRRITNRIKRLYGKIDCIFHIYSTFSPSWNSLDIPYVLYLDYTMALAHQKWSTWASFKSIQDLNLWLKYEQELCQKAIFIFTKSEYIKKSLISDYQIPERNIDVVYSSGNFTEVFQGKKQFGSKKILFNGSDFERKGGALLIDAFRIVRQLLPDVQLNILGEKISLSEDGVQSRGYVSSKDIMKDIFLETDLVVSPAKCEPLGLFLIEAMNYGIPCIVSKSDGMPEIIHHMKNGLVLDNPNPEELADSMYYLLSQPQLLVKMSSYAQNRVKEDLNWHVVAKKILNVVQHL